MIKKLTIAVLARGLSEPVGGVKYFIQDILRAFAAVDANNHYYIFHNAAGAKLSIDQGNITEVVHSCPSKFAYDHLLFPRLISKIAPDVLYCPKTVIPLSVNIPSVVTVYDLLYFPIPGKIELNEYKLLDTLYMRFFIPRSIKRAAAVHTISWNTREDLLSLFKVPPSRVTMAHPGISSFAKESFSREKARRLLRPLNLAEPYLLYTGTESPRKNLSIVIETLGRLKQTIPHHLVYTGSGNEKSVSIDAIVKKHGLQDRVRKLGYVGKDILAALYKTADFYVFPSLYEGFGLPVLEAMSMGCPVICSNTSSIPEVGGDAAFLFDPWSSESLADAILTLTQSHTQRQHLIAKGRARAKMFSYKNTAHELVRLFHGVAAAAR